MGSCVHAQHDTVICRQHAHRRIKCYSLISSATFSCRGKFRSKPWQQLLEEAKYLVESGVKELNLIAEDTNQYGQDRRDGKGLAQLMHELGKLEGLQWMRILYAYPSYFTDDLIDEIATNPKVSQLKCALPLQQHVSTRELFGDSYAGYAQVCIACCCHSS